MSADTQWVLPDWLTEVNGVLEQERQAEAARAVQGEAHNRLDDRNRGQNDLAI